VTVPGETKNNVNDKLTKIKGNRLHLPLYGGTGVIAKALFQGIDAVALADY